MNSKEFVIWLKGFVEGVHEFNVTPKQWDLLKERLAKVDDNPATSNITSNIAIKTGSNSTYTYPIVGVGNLTTTVIDEKTPKTLLND